MVTKQRTPYNKIDPPVRALIRVLNQFPGIHTFTSCGGHPHPEQTDQAEEGFWYVDFHVDRTDEGWVSLEFLAWVAYDVAIPGVVLEPFSKPPYLNQPGEMLFFRWAGIDPEIPSTAADVFAVVLASMKEGFYVTANQAKKHPTT